MEIYHKPVQTELVYFTGTGGTRRVAESFAIELNERGVSVRIHEISSQNSYAYQSTDLLIILYPVYALNAPKPIYDFIRNLPLAKGIPSAVISVSGGGELTPNTACRLHSIKRLEKKGYRVIYESMIVMPSNFLLPTPDELAIQLLNILPSKVEHIIQNITAGVIRRTHPNLINRMLSNFGELEKSRIVGSTIFAKHIKVNKDCNGCGLCCKACPAANIVIRNKVPVFGNKCTLCLRCIYDCPKNALKAGFGKFIVLKQGYNLDSLEARMSGRNIASIESIAKGYSLSGIKKYLLENEE